jgi:hypothetical protein
VPTDNGIDPKGERDTSHVEHPSPQFYAEAERAADGTANDEDLAAIYRAGMAFVLAALEYNHGYGDLAVALNAELPPKFTERCLVNLLMQGEVYRHAGLWWRNPTRSVNDDYLVRAHDIPAGLPWRLRFHADGTPRPLADADGDSVN